MGYSDKEQGLITVRNTIVQIFIHGYSELFQYDNGKELNSKMLNKNLSEIEVKNLYGSPYHPQSQGTIEAFNKKVQKSLSAAYDNVKDEKLGWDAEINLLHFLNFKNCKRKHTTTGLILKYVLDNFKNEKVREKVIIIIQKKISKPL